MKKSKYSLAFFDKLGYAALVVLDLIAAFYLALLPDSLVSGVVFSKNNSIAYISSYDIGFLQFFLACFLFFFVLYFIRQMYIYCIPVFPRRSGALPEGVYPLFSFGFLKHRLFPALSSVKLKVCLVLVAVLSVLAFNTAVSLWRTELSSEGIVRYNCFNQPVETVSYDEVKSYYVFSDYGRRANLRRTSNYATLEVGIITEKEETFVFDLVSGFSSDPRAGERLEGYLSKASKTVYDESFSMAVMYYDLEEGEAQSIYELFDREQTPFY